MLARYTLFALVIFLSNLTYAQQYAVSTVAGTTTDGFVNDTGAAARFARPCGVGIDKGFIYVGDRDNNSIRKINTLTHEVTTLAGDGSAGLANDTGSAARFNFVHATAIDSAGNIYVGDTYNSTVRKVTPAGSVSTLAGNGSSGYSNATGTAAQFSQFRSLDVDRAGNVFVADFYNHCIRKVTPQGVASTLAGSPSNVGFINATGSAAAFYLPHGICVDTFGNVYVAEVGNNCIRKINPAGLVTTFAGSGTVGLLDATGLQAQFAHPTGLAADLQGNIFVADQGNNAIRKITPAGNVTTIAGDGTNGYRDSIIGIRAWFNAPAYVSVDNATGIVYVGDEFNNCVRQLTPVAITAKFNVSDSTICAGTGITFSDLSEHNATGWQWIFAGGTPGTSSAKNPTINYNRAGSFDVTLIASNAQGSDTLTKTGYIVVAPGPSAGIITASADTICSGSSLQLTDSGSTGSIQWQSSANGTLFGNTTGDTAVTLNISAVSNTTYYRVLANNNCGIDSSATLKVVVNRLPVGVINSTDTVICSGDSAPVCLFTSFAAYLWNTGDTTGCTTAKAAGGYWVTVTDDNNCSAVSNHWNISVFPVPSVSILVQGDTIASFNATAYQWYAGDSLIAGATSAVYIANQTGDYSVQITDTNGCKTTSNDVSIIINNILNTAQEELLQVYPNPNTTGIWQLLVNDELISSKLELFDMQGRVVFQSQIQNAKSEIKSAEAGGIYILQLTSGNTTITRRLVRF